MNTLHNKVPLVIVNALININYMSKTFVKALINPC